MSEKEDLELQSGSHYDTVTSETEPTPETEPNDLVDEDSVKELWWVKIFPFLLKWNWLRRRLAKKKDDKKKRGQWDNRAQYILTLLGYAVGLGNVWRFSYLVAKNGGAAFVIPYITMLFVVGIPLFYLETLIGQTLQKGPILAWFKICPNLWGIGLAASVVTVYISLYYNVIMSWVILYFFHSFQDPLPWAKCCGFVLNLLNDTINSNYLHAHENGTVCGGTFTPYSDLAGCVNDSTRYYWYVNTLEANGSINDFSGFNWRIYLCLFAGWVIVYLCMFKGIQSTGKVVYFTAIFPYIVLIILFFRAVTLDGAGDGIKFLFVPDSDTVRTKLFQPQVWLEAATQIFFSLGLSMGALIALSSYSKQNNNPLVDTLIVCFSNSFTSIFSSIIVFSIVGYKANLLNVPPQLVSQGPGLAFVVFSQALTLMPVSPLWAVLFFIMLFLLGIDSQFAGMECLITVLLDSKKIRKIRKEILILIVCTLFFLVSFIFVLGNGLYLFQLFDQYASTLPLLFIGLCEVVTISWIFGANRFLDGISFNLHLYMRRFWFFVWTFMSPIVMIIIFFGSVINEIVQPLQYTVFDTVINHDGEEVMDEFRLKYPTWAQFIGAMITLSSILCIPTVLIIRLIIYHRARKQLKETWLLTKTRYHYVVEKVKGVVFQQSYSPQENELVEEPQTSPYFHADEEQPTPIDALSETSAESEEDSRFPCGNANGLS
ncbi:PREDICTED: sodium-dependent neutral amino acid transporter B(0)AT2-like [Amphimedon queenslandica]|uniref:Transporter n=1 Tax=Amphimedon queenslandica TaxID=400682 RepID=A0AAN0J9E7_AMPQE|nr:PREDICTED: sodium-dependent neutral amino acid transporter B(0)AT2-like [Amphimedon queenslandica]|eukprot:XP_019853351.1 PREDICTED: sodium-dependent neutral amino acid transporter B(0)AT2-like [Amphimedon queenslandica]